MGVEFACPLELDGDGEIAVLSGRGGSNGVIGESPHRKAG
jgi:hypothetical protein